MTGIKPCLTVHGQSVQPNDLKSDKQKFKYIWCAARIRSQPITLYLFTLYSVHYSTWCYFLANPWFPNQIYDSTDYTQMQIDLSQNYPTPHFRHVLNLSKAEVVAHQSVLQLLVDIDKTEILLSGSI